MKDMIARDFFGRQKYGTPLQPFNGRNSIQDLMEELLDAIVYVRSYIEETKWTGQTIMDVRNALVEKGSVNKETSAELASLLTQVLKRNPAFHAE